MRHILGTVLVVLAASGCCAMGSKSSTSDSNEAKPTSDVGPSKTGATTTPTPTHAAGDRAADGLPTDIPATRSKVPTTAEWNDVHQEITVARSTPLGCETKMLREWLRVSCHGKNNTGGTTKSVDKGSGCSAETYVFTGAGVTSVVMPVMRSHSCSVAFEWSDKKQQLAVDWPSGAPRPQIAFKD